MLHKQNKKNTVQRLFTSKQTSTLSNIFFFFFFLDKKILNESFQKKVI